MWNPILRLLFRVTGRFCVTRDGVVGAEVVLVTRVLVDLPGGSFRIR